MARSRAPRALHASRAAAAAAELRAAAAAAPSRGVKDIQRHVFTKKKKLYIHIFNFFFKLLFFLIHLSYPQQQNALGL